MDKTTPLSTKQNTQRREDDIVDVHNRAYVYRALVNGSRFLIKPQSDRVYMPSQSWRDFSNVLYEQESVAVDMHLNEDPCRRKIRAWDISLQRKGILCFCFTQVVVNKCETLRKCTVRNEGSHSFACTSFRTLKIFWSLSQKRQLFFFFF